MYAMRLANSILELHDQILEVYVLEERDGQNVITDEASRSGVSLLAEGMNQMGRNAPLSPSIILGAASQILQGSRPTKLVGILYLGGGVILSPIDEKNVLIASTTASSLFEVMKKISEFLPSIARKGSDGAVNAVNSVSQAEERTITFLTNRPNHPRTTSINVDEITYMSHEQLWHVNGSLQDGIRSKRFHLEMDARDGSIVKFSSPSSRNITGLIIIEVACLVAAAGLLVWILLSKL